MIGNILRFKTAVALVLLGLLTLLAGIGQKTFWAPAETVTATAPSGATAAPLTVFDEKLRTMRDGTVTINVKGEGSFMLAAGRPDDVEAWVGKTAHNTVSGVSEDGKALQLTHADGEATAPSPAGSDLWVSTENASGELKYNWTPPADGDWSLLLATDGTKPAPSSITMTFPNDTSTPWAIPFMVLGGLLILAGAALLVLKPKSGTRPGAGSGGSSDDSTGGSNFARRAQAKAAARSEARKSAAATAAVPVVESPAVDPRALTRRALTPKGAAEKSVAAPVNVLQRLRRSGAVVAVLTATAVAGSGVAAQASQTPAPSPGTSSAAAEQAPAVAGLGRCPVPPHPGTGGQRGRRRRRRQGCQQAGAARGRTRTRGPHAELQDPLPGRLVRGPDAGPCHQAAHHRGHRAAQLAAHGHGRHPGRGQRCSAAAHPDPGLPAGELQAGPHHAAAAGNNLPGDRTRRHARRWHPSDKSGLLYSGEEALGGLGDRLNSADSAFKDKLAEGESSPYIADTLAYQADVVNSGVNGTFSFTHKVVPESVVVFRTADGGALALGRLNFAFDGTPKADGDKLTIGDDAAALAGGKETSTGMVLNFAESVAVYIPPAGSQDPMKLVAATRGLTGASFK